MTLNRVTIAVLAATTLTSLASDDITNTKDTIVVTASRSTQVITDVMADVSVLTQDDIAKLAPQSFSDVLRLVSGIQVAQSGGHGQQSSVFSRGTNSNHTLVLVDGIRVGSSTLGTKEWNSIPVSQIERVEIVRGPMAAQWGSDAIGAVIQIFTRQMAPGEVIVDTTFGSNKAKHIHSSIGLGTEKFNNTLSVSSEYSDGYDVLVLGSDDTDGYRRISAAFRGDLALSDELTLDWVVQNDEGNAEYDNPWGGADEGDYKNIFYNIRYTYNSGEWESFLSVKGSRDYSTQYGQGIIKGDNVFETRRKQANAKVARSLGDEWTVAGGVDWLREDISGSTSTYTQEDRETYSGYVMGQYQSNHWLAEATYRHDDVDAVDTESTYRVSMGYKPNENQLLSFSTGEGFKAPTFNDLYFPASLFSSGNEELLPEYSRTHEVNYKFVADNFDTSLSAYSSEITNLIVWLPDANYFYQPQNVDQAEIKGIDSAFGYHGDTFDHQLNVSFTDHKDASGQRLFRRAKKMASYQLSFEHEFMSFYVSFLHTGKRDDLDSVSYQRITVGSYNRFDLGLNVHFNDNLILKTKLNDVFDAEETSVSGYHPIGREFYFGLTYRNF